MNLINTYYFQELVRMERKPHLCYISAGLDDYEEYEKSASGGISKKICGRGNRTYSRISEKWTGSDIAASEKE